MDIALQECVDPDDIMQSTIRAFAQAQEVLVGADARVVNIAVVLILVYRPRQSP